MKIEKLRGIFVSIERFAPVEKIVYGIVGLILISVGAAILNLIFKVPVPQISVK